MSRIFHPSDVLFTITPEPEHISVRDGNFELSDGSPDEEQIAAIEKQMEHSEWAWCSVKVTASWGGFEGSDHLGCCSYKDEDDFAEGGYLPQMQEEAMEDLKRNIRAAGWEIVEAGLNEEERQAVHDYLFCDSAAMDIAGTHVKGPEAYQRVTDYLNELRGNLAS